MSQFFEHIVMDICTSGEHERIHALRGVQHEELRAWCEEQLELDGVPSSSRFRFSFLRELFAHGSDESATLYTFIQDKTAYALDLEDAPSAAEPPSDEEPYSASKELEMAWNRARENLSAYYDECKTSKRITHELQNEIEELKSQLAIALARPPTPR